MQAALAIVATASSVFGVAAVSAFAQSDTRATRDAAIMHPGSVPVMQVYSGAHPSAATDTQLPQNLVFPELLRPTISKMLARSPTFRRQCQRIAQVPALLVRVMTPPAHTARIGPRARSEIGVTADGRRVANITIGFLPDFVELLGHELEHVIEQLDGIDLRARSSRSNSGVWNCADGSYETVRAVQIGRSVVNEATRRP